MYTQKKLRKDRTHGAWWALTWGRPEFPGWNVVVYSIKAGKRRKLSAHHTSSPLAALFSWWVKQASVPVVSFKTSISCEPQQARDSTKKTDREVSHLCRKWLVSLCSLAVIDPDSCGTTRRVRVSDKVPNVDMSKVFCKTAALLDVGQPDERGEIIR